MRSSSWLLVLIAAPAYAQDEYEIQVYDTETAPRGDPGLELHLNYHLIHAAPDQLHSTLEPHYGLTDWLELGGYVQSSIDTNGNVTFAGVKVRAKMRLYRHGPLGLGINVEGDTKPYGGEVRPIADWRGDRLFAAVNPIVSFDANGAAFEPAAKLAAISGRWMVGVEGYAALPDDVFRAFAVIDVRGDGWDLNAGIGANTGSPDHPIAKLILGFHP